MRIRSIVQALSAAAAFALPAFPAAAADVQVGIRYSDLDLTTEHGQPVLARRIDASATKQIADRVAQEKRG